MRWLAVAIGGGFALGCNPYTSRPPIEPLLGALAIQVDRDVPTATADLLEALEADSIPIRVVSVRDGYLESPWFDSASGKPTPQRPLGPDRVRVRAWIDPGQPGHSRITVEITYRPWADPSLPERELDQLAPLDHPTMQRMQAVLAGLEGLRGGPSPQ